MMNTVDVNGFYLGERVDLKMLKYSLTFECIYEDPTDLIYQYDENAYFQLFDYGSLVFFNIENVVQTDITNSIRKILNLPIEELYSESFKVEVNQNLDYQAKFDKIVVNNLSLDLIKIVMLNIAQSVALDNYIERSNQLLIKTSSFSAELERKGKLSLKGKKLLKFIGSTLNLRNKIARNLYIFDGPVLIWNDEFLNQVYNDLRSELDINLRHKSLQENLDIVKENLDIFRDINQHSHSSTLEWIIIILIAVEIVNMILEKIG